MKPTDIFSLTLKRIHLSLVGNSGEKKWRWTALAVMAGLASGLRFYNLTSLGYANHYYAAAVLSMTKSWHNFFFLAAEPGGAVSLDKPPLGPWFQAVSASIFGINSFGLLLPQLLAGLFSVLLVYYLVRRSLGTGAGLLSGLMMAVMPVVVAVDRNNTMDSILIFTLLLAAWAFIKATETGQLRFLLAGAFLVGLGFNIKMLEAFLPLPAFFLLYFTGATESVRRKLLKLVAATVLLVVVSLSWMTIVDLTDSNQRPYVDNSGNNSEFSLLVGYNGIERLVGPGFNFRLGTKGARFPGTGIPGLFRLITPPLNKEVSWLLPMGLGGILVLVFGSRLKWPFSLNHQTLTLWGGWLVAGGIFFSLAGFIHGYYLSFLAPPLAVMSAVGMIYLWRLRAKHFCLLFF
jgi:4-amino-4-deoxy-L-arabinose transferase-like glycosyltransferase